VATSSAAARRNFIVPKKWNCHEDTIGEDVEWERTQGFKKNVMVAIPAYNEEVAIGSVILRARRSAAFVTFDQFNMTRSILIYYVGMFSIFT
jgi:hypothetical protein